MSNYRVTIHGVPTREQAERIARGFRIEQREHPSSALGGTSVSVGPDDVPTAEREYARAVRPRTGIPGSVSLRKDTPSHRGEHERHEGLARDCPECSI